MREPAPSIGIIGGSSLYEIEGFSQPKELRIKTPFGTPSDVIVGGDLAGRSVYFLPRHGKGHRIMPHEINHRANVWALRSLGVRWIICVTAVGSLKAKYKPEHIVLPSQYFDRTSRSTEHTFFGSGIVAHVGFAEPTSAELRAIIVKEAKALGLKAHNGGTYVNMDGPAFSTRAESQANRQLGFDVIGMTNLAEAKLAREAEIALATISMITDYDCWKTDEPPVDAQTVIKHLLANAKAAKTILARVIPQIPQTPDWPEHTALDSALVTDRSLWPAATIKRLKPILNRILRS